MTRINIDYKYFAGARDPIVILNKYRMRGFSVILNTNEKSHMLYYNQNVKVHNGMFSVDDNKTMFGPKKLDNKIFKPMIFIEGCTDDVYNDDNNKYINSLDDLKNVYKNKYSYNYNDNPIDIFKFNAINKNGYINPLQTWIISAMFNNVL